jgi:transcriptional regulator with XRE-family HTH domain
VNADAAKKTLQLFSKIGRRIRLLRLEKGLSLNELAKKSGFAKSYLSQIENLKREPSIGALSQMAHALEVDILYILGDEEIHDNEDNSIAIVRKNDRKAVNRSSGKNTYMQESLTYNKQNRSVEAYIATMGFEFPVEPFVHTGQEIMFVLDGKEEFSYNGKVYTFEEGDCYYFDSDKPHRSRSLGEKPCKVLVVFSAEKR